MANVEFTNLVRQYGRTTALKSVSGVFGDGLVTCMLGPSGCGKTTLLRTIAGLEQPNSGTIRFDGTAVEHLPVSARNVGMVFQAPVVYRGLSVWDNIALPLHRARVGGSEIRKAVDEVLDLLDLGALATSVADRLNAGDRQKVAIARAVARRPRVLLLDEPLTNVSGQERAVLKRALKRLLTYRHDTVVYVTHDQSEAMTLADVMVVMQDGVIMQHGAPRDLYESPQDEFVGWFLGAPGMNFLHLANDRSEVGRRVEGLWEPDLRARIVRAGNLGSIGFRPEYVRVALNPQHGWSEGIVQHAALTTCGQILLTAQVGTTTVVAKHAGLSLLSKGHRVWMRIPSEHVHFFGPDGQRMSLEPVVADEVDPEPVGSRPIPSV